MENLLNCDGKRYACKIYGTEVTGIITVEDGKVYLCQNEKSGCACRNMRGYSCSWAVEDGSHSVLSSYGVTDFRLRPLTQSEVDSYKDWQVGDQMTEGSTILTVIFRSGELVVCKNEDGNASGPFTCDELYNSGFRLVPEELEEDTPVEVTLEEIAAWKGIPVDKLKIIKA